MRGEVVGGKVRVSTFVYILHFVIVGFDNSPFHAGHPEHVTLKCRSRVETDGQSAMIWSAFKMCQSMVGDFVYANHAEASVKAWVTCLISRTVVIGSVKASFLSGVSLDKTLALLVTNPSPDAHALYMEKLVGTAFDKETFFESSDQRRVFSLVKDFSEILNLTALDLTDALEGRTDKPESVDIKFALLILEILCAGREVASLAHALDVHLFKASTDGKLIKNDSTLFAFVPSCLKVISELLAWLEEALSGPTAQFVECSTEFSLKTSFVQLREWRDGMAVFNGGMRKTYLTAIAGVLENATDELDKISPKWEACFDGGVFDEALGLSMTKGKARIVVAQQNRLLEILNHTRNQTRLLDMMPKAEDDPITRHAIKVAATSVYKARTSCVFIEGCDLLVDIREKSQGAQLAKDFLKKHEANDDAKPLFDVFWKEFKHVSRHAARLGTPTKSTGSDSSAKRKLEEAAQGNVPRSCGAVKEQSPTAAGDQKG